MTRASSVLGYKRIVLANMCASSTRSVVELNTLVDDGWELARVELASSLKGASAVLAGWGVAGLTGNARRSMEAQVEWLGERARGLGITAFWMVGGKPRHPSRWHQYVSDKYGHTTGGSFEERIAQVLVEVPIIRPERQRVVEMRIERTPPHLLGRM